jgi:hypothetical protein
MERPTLLVPRLRDKGDLLIGAMSRSHIFEVPGVDFINLLKADLSGKATKCHGKVEKQDFLPTCKTGAKENMYSAVNRRSGNPGCTFSKCASVYKCVSGSKT